ncbi:hypothetical protein MUO98_06635, partial [Candidatus Bathyarchaeota archaeon]|nr:hypothetical protein [Candidatus Bathyarchaeota archaeon]
IMEQAIPPEGSAVHVRYLESGTSKTLLDVAERETLGWLNSNTGKEIYIQHDRTVESLQNSHGSASGIRIPISSIVKICLVDKRESD